MDRPYENYLVEGNSEEPISGAKWSAQAFTPQENHNLAAVIVRLRKEGLVGTVTASIRSTDINGLPAGNDLCSGTLDNISEEYAWYLINFTSYYKAQAGIKLALILRAPDAVGTLYWRFDSGTPAYHRGLLIRSEDSGTTWILPATFPYVFPFNFPVSEDHIFEERGYPIMPSRAVIIG